MNTTSSLNNLLVDIRSFFEIQNSESQFKKIDSLKSVFRVLASQVETKEDIEIVESYLKEKIAALAYEKDAKKLFLTCEMYYYFSRILSLEEIFKRCEGIGSHWISLSGARSLFKLIGESNYKVQQSYERNISLDELVEGKLDNRYYNVKVPANFLYLNRPALTEMKVSVLDSHLVKKQPQQNTCILLDRSNGSLTIWDTMNKEKRVWNPDRGGISYQKDLVIETWLLVWAEED